MKLARSGIILNVENFDECVSFYKNVFALEVLFTEEKGSIRLCCFEFGGAYLMIETGGFSNLDGKSIDQSAAKLRFNVIDIDAALAQLKCLGVDAKIQRFDWGATINMFDPDGNRIGITDEPRFARQILKTE